eukprot:9369920-Karenia_brevis.AAC.2
MGVIMKISEPVEANATVAVKWPILPSVAMGWGRKGGWEGLGADVIMELDVDLLVHLEPHQYLDMHLDLCDK